MKEIKELKRKKGFTLIEAAVSLLILGIALGAMLGAFVIGRFSVSNAKHRTEAMNHARAAMEKYIDDGTTTFTLPDADIKSLGGSCSVAETKNYGGFTGLTRIVVTISWNERTFGGSKQLSEQLVTLVRE